MLTEHDPVTRTQEPPGVKTTFPVGVIPPEPAESATTAVQLVAWLTTTPLGLQVTVVEVVRRATERLNGWELVLPLWVPSPL
jgi:hypothetical protein